MAMRRFRPTLLGTAAATLGVAATIGLGFWQLDRARQKEDLAAKQERLFSAPVLRLDREVLPAEALESRHVEAYGRFEPEAMVWLDNRIRHGVVGYEVVMPLRIAGRQLRVLVNRGWIAGTGDRRRLPAVTTPDEDVKVRGRAVIPGKRIYELGAEPQDGRVWQNLTIERYRARLQIEVLPIMIEQVSDIGDGLVRDWAAPDTGVNTHRSYALQWFALAALIAVIYLAACFPRDATNA